MITATATTRGRPPQAIGGQPPRPPSSSSTRSLTTTASTRRSAVSAHATHAGLAEGRVYDLVAAAHELAANAVQHGGGAGRLRLWHHNQARPSSP